MKLVLCVNNTEHIRYKVYVLSHPVIVTCHATFNFSCEEI
jgi:hypothetical protein